MNIKELADNLGLEEDEYLELADLLVDTGLVDLEKMTTAIEAGNNEEASKAAHSIKGASGNLGLMDIYELAKALEAELRNNQLDSITPKINEIREKLETLGQLARG